MKEKERATAVTVRRFVKVQIFNLRIRHQPQMAAMIAMGSRMSMAPTAKSMTDAKIAIMDNMAMVLPNQPSFTIWIRG